MFHAAYHRGPARLAVQAKTIVHRTAWYPIDGTRFGLPSTLPPPPYRHISRKLETSGGFAGETPLIPSRTQLHPRFSGANYLILEEYHVCSSAEKGREPKDNAGIRYTGKPDASGSTEGTGMTPSGRQDRRSQTKSVYNRGIIESYTRTATRFK